MKPVHDRPAPFLAGNVEVKHALAHAPLSATASALPGLPEQTEYRYYDSVNAFYHFLAAAAAFALAAASLCFFNTNLAFSDPSHGFLLLSIKHPNYVSVYWAPVIVLFWSKNAWIVTLSPLRMALLHFPLSYLPGLPLSSFEQSY